MHIFIAQDTHIAPKHKKKIQREAEKKAVRFGETQAGNNSIRWLCTIQQNFKSRSDRPKEREGPRSNQHSTKGRRNTIFFLQCLAKYRQRFDTGDGAHEPFSICRLERPSNDEAAKFNSIACLALSEKSKK